MADERRWLTIAQAAEHTGTDEAWILERVKAGQLRCAVTARRKSDGPKGPKRRIFDRQELDALMSSLLRSEEAPAPAAPRRGRKPAPTPHPDPSGRIVFRLKDGS
jgi:hypothetical protein